MPKLPIGDIGPAEVIWDPLGTPIDLGATLGKIELKHEDSAADVQEERYGDMAVDSVFSGGAADMSITLTRSEWSILKDFLPGVSFNAPNELVFSTKCGSDMYVNAKPIYLKPIKDLVISILPAEWTQVFKCYPTRAISLGFDRKEQRVMNIKFKVFPCQESGVEGKLYTLGVNP